MLASVTSSLNGIGLRDVPSARLRTLLRAVYRNETAIPVTPAGLTALGLQDWCTSLLSTLRGLDGPAVHAVLVSVLAERA